MSALILLGQARSAGLQLTIDGERLVVRGDQRLAGLAQAVLARKPEVVLALRIEAALRGSMDGIEALDLGDWIERFEERAAVMEFDGGLPRHEAERKAMEATVEAIAREPRRNA